MVQFQIDLNLIDKALLVDICDDVLFHDFFQCINCACHFMSNDVDGTKGTLSTKAQNIKVIDAQLF